MEYSEEGTRKDEEDQRERSTKKVKMDGENYEISGEATSDERQKRVLVRDVCEEQGNVTAHQEGRVKDSISYKNMLLGINGMRDGYNNDETETWMDEEDS